MSTRATAETTQRELSYRKRLIEIANLINSAPGIQEILVDLKDKILDLVEAERVTIFALDTKNQELYSLFKAGNEVKEIRVAEDLRLDRRLHARSRARRANINDAYDAAELTRLHAEPPLRLALGQGVRLQDARRCWRRPILFDKYLLGVLQLVNKRGGGDVQRARRGGGRGAREDPGHRLLQPAPGGPHQQALEVRPARRQGPALREGRREGARRRARQPARRREDPARGLQRRPRPSCWAPLGALLRRAALVDLARSHDAGGPQGAALARLPEEEHVRAAREEGRHAQVAVEDPYDLTRLDAIKAMNVAPRLRLRGRAAHGHPGLHQRDLRPDADLRRGAGPRPHHHAAGQRRRGRDGGRASRTPEAEIDETDSGIVKLCNQIIIDAYNRGASDIHVEPYGKTAPTPGAPPRRRRLLEVPGDPRAPPQRARAAPQDHGAGSTSPRSASPRTARSASAARWARSSCASPPSPPRAATRTW